VDDLIDEKLGGPSSPIKAKAMPRSKSISAKKGRRSSAVVDEKQSTHNQLALMDIDNLQLAVGQVHSCPHRVWFVCVCVCVCVCVNRYTDTQTDTHVSVCVSVCVYGPRRWCTIANSMDCEQKP